MILTFPLFTLWSLIFIYLQFYLCIFPIWHMNLLHYDPWGLNWYITNLPLTVVLILGFAYFIFSIILFRKNTLLLLLYPKLVIELSGYNLGCYKHNYRSYLFHQLVAIFLILEVQHIHQYLNNFLFQFNASCPNSYIKFLFGT